MNKMKEKLKKQVFAIVGKGGVGKTTFTLLFSRILKLHNIRPLLIDADPTMSHLARTLGVDLGSSRNVEQIRMEVIRTATSKDKNKRELVAKSIDRIIRESIIESEDFSLLMMGQPETSGCFCPSNSLMKLVIEDIIDQYDIVLIDCEAGIEQIQRNVISSVDYLIVVTDTSMRSIETARAIKSTAKKFTHYKKIGLVLNRVKEMHGNLLELIRKKIDEIELPLLGMLPDDMKLTEIEIQGQSLNELSPDSPSFLAVQKIIEEIMDLKE